jgi:hypothetical protein
VLLFEYPRAKPNMEVNDALVYRTRKSLPERSEYARRDPSTLGVMGLILFCRPAFADVSMQTLPSEPVLDGSGTLYGTTATGGSNGD